MTKQEEIREGIAKWVSYFVSEGKNMSVWGMVDLLLGELHSQGVVIIDRGRKLPERIWYSDWGGESGKAGYELALEDMAGYEAVEPLIKEANNVDKQEKTG